VWLARLIAVIPEIFPDETLHTNRLVLRTLTAGHVDDVHLACRDAETQRWLPLPRPYTHDVAAAFCLELAPGVRSSGVGIVRGIEWQGRLAGVIDLKRPERAAGSVEIGYWTSPWARNRGVMTEAVDAFASWATDELGFQRVEIRAATGNDASQRVALKAGFLREGVLRRAGYTHDGRVDLVVLSRLDDDPRPRCSP
jgi:RimJ/RimL family protein N-acetyltransferase